MSPRPFPRWLLPAALLLLTLAPAVPALLAWQHFADDLPIARVRQADGNWLAAVREQLEGIEASDAWNSLFIAGTIAGVELGRDAPSAIGRIRSPLQQIADPHRARFWLLAARLAQLRTAPAAPDDWWPTIGREVEFLEHNPPTHGLAALLRIARETYMARGLDPASAANLTLRHYGYNLGPALQAALDLLDDAREHVTAEQAARIDNLVENLLADWVRQDGPAALRMLAAQRLAEHYERTGTNAERSAELRRWRDAYRTKIAGYPQTMLGVSSDPTPAGDLQATWIGNFVAATWMIAAAAGLLPLALAGFVLILRGASLPPLDVVGAVVVGLVLAGLPWLLLSTFDEWMLHAVRLGFPWNPDDARIPAFAWAAALAGLALPILCAVVARRRSAALTVPAFALPVVALACWLTISQAATRRADFVSAASRAHQAELTSPVPNHPVLAPKDGPASE